MDDAKLWLPHSDGPTCEAEGRLLGALDLGAAERVARVRAVGKHIAAGAHLLLRATVSVEQSDDRATRDIGGARAGRLGVVGVAAAEPVGVARIDRVPVLAGNPHAVAAGE